MSTKPDDGGPAFPVIPTYNPDGTVWYHGMNGMTLRDWFAGMALQGTAANPAFRNEKWAEHAASSYRAADAMLAARKEATR